MNFIRIFLTGIVIGMANVIPGVSGGTLAVVFNIYDQFVNAITLNVKKLIENRKFIVPILLGMATGVLLFSKLITILYEKFPVQTNYCFTGLILGSIPMLFGYVTKKSDSSKKFSVPAVIGISLCAIAGFALLIWFSSLEGTVDRTAVGEIMPEFTWPLATRIFIAGVVGAIAMVIPGISGSLIMLIMGVYTIVITCIPALFVPSKFFHALILLLPNGIGVLAGLISGAKLVSILLKKFPNHTYAVIFGLICASAVNLFPGFACIKNPLMAVACVISLAAGFSLAYFTSKTTSNEKSEAENE